MKTPRLLMLTRLARAFPAILFFMVPCLMLAQITNSIIYVAPNATGTANLLYSISPSGGGNTAINLTNILDVTNPGWSRDAKQPQIVATGTKLGDSAQNVFVFPPTGGSASEITAFTNNDANVPPPEALWSAFSPDSQQLAVSYWYQYNVPDQGTEQCTAFLVFGADGSGLKSAVGGKCFDPGAGNFLQGEGIDWSPDPASNLLVLPAAYFEDCGFTAPVPVTELWAVAPSPGSFNQPTHVTVTRPCPSSLLEYVFDISPAFSPVKAQVAFVRVIQNIFFNTFVFSLQVIPLVSDGKHSHQVGQTFTDIITHVSWSPDGSQLVFDRVVSFGPPLKSNGLWIINQDGTGLKQLPNTASSANAPSWWAPASNAPKKRRGQLTSQ